MIGLIFAMINQRINLSIEFHSDTFQISERYFNFPTKIDYRIKLFLETDITRLFESRKVLAASTTSAPAPDTEILFTRAPFIQYEQILLDKNFRQHLETIMVSKK